MNYRTNEDKRRCNGHWGPLYNAVLEVKLVDSGAVTEPITLVNAKIHLNIAAAITDFDTVITKLITQARKTVEDRRGIVIIKKTVTTILRNDLGGQRLPYGPVLTITSVKDIEDVLQTTDQYKIRGTDFPWLEYPTSDFIKLVYESGYNGSPPHDIVKEVYTELAWLFSNRGDEVHEKNHSGVWLI